MNGPSSLNIAASQEQRFLALLNIAAPLTTDIQSVLCMLDKWQDELYATLDGVAWPVHALRPQSAFVAQVQEIGQLLQALPQRWAQQRLALQPAQELAEVLEDRIILQVFGKFNAGKSALCNLLAQRFSAYEEQVKYFHLEDGKILDSQEPFKEGETETTARIQGVSLGDKLVLLDTPGLHSVTPENAALTKSFVESADALLWLSSSASPGQTQELDELSNELHRSKPLLPVLTRSDVFEEDEVDGEIVKRLRNKTAENRAVQEADVTERARRKLETMGLSAGMLVAPVSVSTYMARHQGLSPDALADGGFENLYAALCAIVEPALAYKRRKPAEVLLHHLEENVLGSVRAELLPKLDEIDAALQLERHFLQQLPAQITASMWRGVGPALPAILERHASSRDVRAVCADVVRDAAEALDCVLSETLPGYVIDQKVLDIQVRLNDDVRYEEYVVGVAPEPSEPAPPPGSPNSSASEPYVVDVSHERLHAALQSTLSALISQISVEVAEQCRSSILRLEECVAGLREDIRRHCAELGGIKNALRLQARWRSSL